MCGTQLDTQVFFCSGGRRRWRYYSGFSPAQGTPGEGRRLEQGEIYSMIYQRTRVSRDVERRSERERERVVLVWQFLPLIN